MTRYPDVFHPKDSGSIEDFGLVGIVQYKSSYAMPLCQKVLSSGAKIDENYYFYFFVVTKKYQ